MNSTSLVDAAGMGLWRERDSGSAMGAVEQSCRPAATATYRNKHALNLKYSPDPTLA